VARKNLQPIQRWQQSVLIHHLRPGGRLGRDSQIVLLLNSLCLFGVQASAVQKIARVMPLKEGLTLYRGLGGPVSLPRGFFKSDVNGCRGFVEWGFMSTTANKEVAIDYSEARKKSGKDASSKDWRGAGRGSLPIVLVVRVSAVDRGACIRDFSQYMQEVEYLWVPGSYLQQVRLIARTCNAPS
jgi:hypothetical protein